MLGAALPLFLLVELPEALAEPPETVPVPCAPAAAIKDEQVPVGEVEDLVVAEPPKLHAEALLVPVAAR